MADGAALEGYWLPGISEAPAERLEHEERAFGPGRVPIRVPVLTPRLLRSQLSALRDGTDRLRAWRSARIVEVIGAASRRLVEPGSPLREHLVEVMPELTGYSRPMIEIGLERMGDGWTAGALRRALEGELGSTEVLDEFRPRPGGGSCRAFGPALTFHVFSGNIPGVAVSSLIRALCVKSASFGKTAAGEPYLAVCFCRALAEEDAELAGCLAVSHWPGGSTDLEAVALEEAEAVVVYGSDETVADIGARVPPSTRLHAYPNRVGVAVVSRRALTSKAAPTLVRALASDVVMFDQQGCVSPHAIYVQRGGAVAPLELAERLADALVDLAERIPRGPPSAGESSLIHQLRAQAEMRGATVFASQRGTDWTVILEERSGFEPSPLNRVIQVHPIDDLSEALTLLRPVGRHLQTVALAADPSEVGDLAGELGAVGATRIVAPGEAPWPRSDWHHDGRFQYLDLVRFVDLEA
ncbi:MAG: acyl-CoA reductase [Gemmatimonadetes bacterium]|uniref:Acyl-CoA reductase n=1 Tax=Candidatus Kutchimonas denitrificans TaxID=3056748 RepID=A0AAE4ZCQ6_9BACT|nr:acyl-CoA reductase [Gemmatimonadota bacterium]NIR76121.1 acyl-CoA reductase [Candidatus Kutchimonas denitrificans]NIS00500.1 acyl-CoA reductase [Gemmatimonadota bacterium]NIT66158.1 acyl-CoA reductase [Gemmatimonadota bacterium]NIU54236.1 acyl-CoA reductase [Gemmatimonadota bacterium]